MKVSKISKPVAVLAASGALVMSFGPAAAAVAEPAFEQSAAGRAVAIAALADPGPDDLLDQLRPALIRALRVGGPIAAGVLETIGRVAKSIPDIGGNVETILRSVAEIVRHGASRLADLLEATQRSGVSKAEARKAIAEHLTTVEKVGAETAAPVSIFLSEVYGR
ncbi:hypothetical protein HUW46_00868 [Amycolatopsis sp. CA-230715]|nr:hypothetical protein HUW46_00868 [Amycolatopsis sp. CA-230715]